MARTTCADTHRCSAATRRRQPWPPPPSTAIRALKSTCSAPITPPHPLHRRWSTIAPSRTFKFFRQKPGSTLCVVSVEITHLLVKQLNLTSKCFRSDPLGHRMQMKGGHLFVNSRPRSLDTKTLCTFNGYRLLYISRKHVKGNVALLDRFVYSIPDRGRKHFLV